MKNLWQDGAYIRDEPNKLQIFYSTVDRKRGTTKLWLVGNTISKICPYLKDWGLLEIMRSIKQGEIKTKEIQNEENKVVIAIEYCRSSGGKTMAIGSAKTMIDSGSWQTEKQPKLKKSIKEFKSLYKIGFYYQGYKFMGEYLVDIKKPDDFCWFIYPYYKEFDNKTFIFSDIVKISPYWQRSIYDIRQNERLRNFMIETFRENKIFYSSDLCGTDFKQAIDFEIRR